VPLSLVKISRSVKRKNRRRELSDKSCMGWVWATCAYEWSPSFPFSLLFPIALCSALLFNRLP